MPYWRHTSKNNPIITLIHTTNFNKEDVRYRNSSRIDTGLIQVTKKGYRLFIPQHREADGYLNCALNNNGRYYPARYVIHGASDDSKHIVYKKINSRSIIHLSIFTETYLVYDLDTDQVSNLEQVRTCILSHDNNFRVQDGCASKHWYMPLRTRWIVPEGITLFNPDQIGLYNVIDVRSDDPTVKITFGQESVIKFEASQRCQIEIVRE